MDTRLHILRLMLVVCLLAFFAGSGWAKVSGKISGVVEDSENGTPLVGATIRVDGTNLVTETDEDGEYFVIGVPVGKYDLTVTHVGYESMTKKDVRVLVDLTTPVDFTVPQMAVEIAKQVVVYAKAPTIKKDLTASRVIYTEDRIRSLPATNSVQNVLTNYPGVVMDRDNAMHVRGGRFGQVSYYYDGFNVQDPFTASAGIRIMPWALQELSLTSGGFTAAYGEALSGIVSAVTPEGGADYRGFFRTYQGATHPYDVSSGKWGNLSLVTDRNVSASLSGPIPGLSGKDYSFYTAGEYYRDDGFLPHNWSTYYTGLTKISLQPMSNLKIRSNVTYSKGDGGLYEHRDVNDRSYDFNLDGLPIWEREAYLAGVSGNYVASDRVIFSVSYERFETETQYAPAHLFDLHWSEWPGYSEDENGVYNGTIHETNYGNDPDLSDPMQAAGYTVGSDYEPTYSYRNSLYNSLSANVTGQINKSNQVNAGFEYRIYDTKWDFKQFYNSQPYGENYTNSPKYAAIYVEDKIEYDHFVVNLGLRWDYRDTDIRYNPQPGEQNVEYAESESNSRLSPRLGISFPVAERSVFHFNYGVYYQAARYTFLYTNLDGDLTTGVPIVGNPNLAPEETVAFELGVDHMLADDLKLDITAYYKDINDLVTVREYGQVPQAGGGMATVSRFTNEDYGSVQGFDISLEKLPIGSNFSGSISYGYMIAKGLGSSAYEPYYTYLNSEIDTLAPQNEYTLDFDQRHTLSAVLEYRAPRDWHGDLFGMKIPGAWGLTAVGRFGSGLPYTKTDALGNRLGDRNESRLPSNYTVNMRFNKDFYLSKARLLTFFVEVDNLFDRKNVLDVYSRTGAPDDDGESPSTGLVTDTEALDMYDQLFDHDPSNFSVPRTVRMGFEFRF